MSSSGNRSWIENRSWGWVVALAAAALTVGVAAPAVAKDEFEDAFKHELGRIAAHGAVSAGRHILGAVIHGGHPNHRGHQGRSYGYPGHYSYYYDYDHHGHGYYYEYRDYGHHYGHSGHYKRWSHGQRGHQYRYYRTRGRGHHVSNHGSGHRDHRGAGHLGLRH